MTDEMTDSETNNPLHLVSGLIDVGYRIKGTGTGYVVSLDGVSLHPSTPELPDSITALNVLVAHLHTQADA